MKFIKHILILAAFTFIGISCTDDDPVAVNPEEVITTLTVTLTPQGGGTAITLKSYDLDGTDGPDAPIITVSGKLAANTVYTGATEVLNETEDPAEDVTVEVVQEGDEHQFFYTFSNNLGSTTYTDTDADGNPIGVTFTLNTADASTGNLTVTLIHEPVKDASGVKTGSISNAGGETDVEATFPITIE